ncbi:hypothetical protein J2Z35_002908 [Acetoanaerobium pronyense]|uniref:Uncharacterized protein n=1 Tax=Acetoanaerobium pronyense TaxID=1482736 RepID=A0ABS4KP27_9FIRM|nr:hypothetical protein [Acetoanaerobium pronyense]
MNLSKNQQLSLKYLLMAMEQLETESNKDINFKKYVEDMQIFRTETESFKEIQSIILDHMNPQF